MLPENRIPTHPGEILLEEFLNPLGLSQVAFAICLANRHIGVPVQRMKEIDCGKRGNTPENAWLFSKAFGTSPKFWMLWQAAVRNGKQMGNCRCQNCEMELKRKGKKKRQM